MSQKTAEANQPPLPQKLKAKWYAFALAGIVLLSFGLNFYAISQLGYGNAYYAAAIKSMTQSWHNFFFISFDPAGLVSVDKPPLGLWTQALFVLVFGYHGWAMLLPQALAGAGSSAMMYTLTAKRFGRPAGLAAALVFAVTPAVVVASRNNTMDMQLIFVLLVAVWFFFRSIETGKWRWLFLCAVLVGIGFNVKMLQAYLILPAAALVYLLCAKEKLGKRFLAGIISVVIMAAVSVSWAAAVDFTPASERPYVGSSTNNTELQLIIGHNGMERIGGQSISGGMGRNLGGAARGNLRGGTPPAMPNQNGQANNGMPPSRQGQNGQAQNRNFPGNQNGAQNGKTFTRSGGAWGSRTNGIGTRGGMGGVGNDIGTAGILRMFQPNMYGQVSWLLLPSLFCILACVHKPRKKGLTPKQGIFLFWVLWLVTMTVFFSFASFYHRYYLCMMAPGIAGVVGIGFPEMLRAFRERKGWRQWLLPLATACSAGLSAGYVWENYEALRTTLFPVIAISGVTALALMAFFRFRPSHKKMLASLAAVFTAVSVLAGSFYWSLTATFYVCENVTMPYAGPELASTQKTPGMTANQEAFTSSDQPTQALENYLVKNYKEGSYLVVAQRANSVAQFIVDTGLPAVAYGGFLGSDNVWTLEQFKQLVAEGKVTYVLLSGEGGMGGGSGSSEIVSYVKSNAKLVNASAYGGSSGVENGSLYLFGSSQSK